MVTVEKYVNCSNEFFLGGKELGDKGFANVSEVFSIQNVGEFVEFFFFKNE